MKWTAIIPFKQGSAVKSRLSAVLTPAARSAFAQEMVQSVISALQGAPAIERVIILSPGAMSYPGVDWCQDRGAGLNLELESLRNALNCNCLIVHADLPLLAVSDISEICEAAGKTGIAIAPDRHGLGTNAIALAKELPFRPAFGQGSFEQHRQVPSTNAAIVWSVGLSTDVDTPEDLAFYRERSIANTNEHGF